MVFYLVPKFISKLKFISFKINCSINLGISNDWIVFWSCFKYCINFECSFFLNDVTSARNSLKFFDSMTVCLFVYFLFIFDSFWLIVWLLILNEWIGNIHEMRKSINVCVFLRIMWENRSFDLFDLIEMKGISILHRFLLHLHHLLILLLPHLLHHHYKKKFTYSKILSQCAKRMCKKAFSNWN